MPNTSSAKKALRQIVRRTLINKMRKTRIKTAIKKVLVAIASGDKLIAQQQFRIAQPILHKSIGKNILHKNNVARKLSRLSAKIKIMAGQFITGPMTSK